MTGLEWIKQMHEVCQFQSKEGAKVGTASFSELRRWLNNGVVTVNGQAIRAESKMPDRIEKIVLFPKNQRQRVTLW